MKTCQGSFSLAVTIDLYSRRVSAWSMQSRMRMDFVLSAFLMVVWRRKPKSKVIIHSDQESQLVSFEWQASLKMHNLEASMSRCVNSYDNMATEIFSTY
jgi:putative transposase